MKRLFILSLLFFWGIGVALPYATYLLFEVFNTGMYGYVPDVYLHKSAIILTISVFISVLIILALPVGRGLIEPKYEIGSWYIVALLLIYSLSRLRMGGGTVSGAFEATTNGGFSGTIVAYVSLFCDLTEVFFLYFLCVKKKINYLLITVLYVIYTILCASRSGLMTVFFILVLAFFTSEKIKVHRKKILIGLLACVLMAPYIFVISTANRGSSAGWNASTIMNTIVGRCSQLELSGIALYKSENGMWNEEVFERKYDIVRQAELIINSTIPGDLFEGDVDPNQYFRTAFFGVPEKLAHDRYTSMNMTLPVYMAVKYGMIVGVLMTIMIAVNWYILCCGIKNQALKILLTIEIRDIFTFFDWVMIWKVVFPILLTSFVFIMLERTFRHYLINNDVKIKKKKTHIRFVGLKLRKNGI